MPPFEGPDHNLPPPDGESSNGKGQNEVAGSPTADGASEAMERLRDALLPETDVAVSDARLQIAIARHHHMCQVGAELLDARERGVLLDEGQHAMARWFERHIEALAATDTMIWEWSSEALVDRPSIRRRLLHALEDNELGMWRQLDKGATS